MKPLHLLLVSLRQNWRDSLLESLSSAGYLFKFKEVANKKEALLACNQSKYDALITSCGLPDGTSADLVMVLGNTMPCLVIRDGCPPETFIHPSPFSSQAAHLPPPAHPLSAWVALLQETIRQWESTVATRLDDEHCNQRTLFQKAAVRCADELHYRSENSIDNVLDLLLNVLEVSRVYIREGSIENSRAFRMIYEVSSSGQFPALGPYRSVYEVLLSESNGSRRFLGVEDIIVRRTWNPAETDLLGTVAFLLSSTWGENIRPASGLFGNILRSDHLPMAS